MPKARMVLENVTYLVTRRTSQRFFRFPPADDVVKDLFLFCLAYAAAQTGVLVHGWILMSNHYHLIITDVRGEAPVFFQKLNQNFAWLLKRHFGIPEEIWNGSQTSAVDLSNELCPSEDTVIEKLVYTMGNAKESGLVARWSQWEGALSRPEDMGKRVVRIRRPDCASSRSSLPEKVVMAVTIPPVLEGWERGELIELLKQQLRDIEPSENPVGMERIKQQGIWDRPATEPRKTGIQPHVAGGKKREAMVLLLRAFREAYACALVKHCAGEECVFPEGTWKMHRVFGVRVEGRDPPALAA